MDQSNPTDSVSIIIALVIFFLPLLFVWLSKRKRQKIQLALEQMQLQLKSVQQESVKSKQQVAALKEKYSPIIDMELHAQQLLDEAQEVVATNRHEAEELVGEAEKNNMGQSLILMSI
ncbi:MAG: putative membrane protein YhiD involved in acid resistance [Phenylobacterium sp.]|jgi:uncharacterized membrane protein YhiD involved in acid resistance